MMPRFAKRTVYLCSWIGVPGGYRVWLMSDPTVLAEAADFDDADELLYERMIAVTGDGENQHEYVPPRPAATAGTIDRGRLWRLGPGGGVTISHEPPYFEGGLCEHCLMPLGPRTAVPLLVSAVTGGRNAASVRLANAGGGPALIIVSERLLAIFTDRERDAFEWRPVAGASKRRHFVEMIPRIASMPYVSPSGLATRYGRCETCGFVWTSPTHGKGLPDYYVSEADLPRPARTLVPVNQRAYAMPAVTDERWRTLVGDPVVKGIQGIAVAIIRAESVQTPTQFVPRPRAKRGW